MLPFLHPVLADVCRCCLPHSRDVPLSEWECWAIAWTQMKSRACARRMAEQRGIHDVIFHATARPFVPGCALDLIVPVLMLPRACAVHALSPRHAGRGRDPTSGDGEALGLQCNHDDVHDTESGAGL